MGLQNDAKSANRLYFWLMHELLNCKNTLMEVKTTNYDIRATYVSPFISKIDNKVYVFVHAWRSRYFQPNTEDLAVLKDKGLPCDADTAYIDGHASLITGYACSVNRLTGELKKFFNRRFPDTKECIKICETVKDTVEKPVVKDKQLPDNIDQIPDNFHWDDLLLEVDYSDKTPHIKLPRDFTLHKKEHLSGESVPVHP